MASHGPCGMVLHGGQKDSFNPNWTIRSEFGSVKLSCTTAVILPTVLDDMLLLGSWKFTLLKMSKSSARNFRLIRSVSLVLLRTPRSVLKNLGPSRMYLPAFP